MSGHERNDSEYQKPFPPTRLESTVGPDGRSQDENHLYDWGIPPIMGRVPVGYGRLESIIWKWEEMGMTIVMVNEEVFDRRGEARQTE